MALFKYKSFLQKASLSACLFLCVVLNGYAQESIFFTPAEEKAYDALWALDEKGIETATPISSANMLYISNLYATLDIILSDDASKFEAYEEALEERLEELENMAAKEPLYSFFKAELMLQSAFVHLKFGHELEASWVIRQAYHKTVKNAENFPAFKPHLKTLGLLHVLIGSIPSKYEWLLSLLGMEGSIENGLAELQRYARSNESMAQEASLLLKLVHSYLLNGQYTMEETSFSTSTPLAQFVQLLISLKKANGPQALATFLWLDRAGFPYPFLYYLGGEAYLRKGNFQKAIKQYSRFIQYSKGTSNVKDAYYKTWLAYHLLGDSTQSQKYLKLASSHGETRSEADKYASKALKKGIAPNALIMRLRLLTDGGYYPQADSLIDIHPYPKFETLSEKVEFDYRKARLAHKQGKIDKAITLYEQVIGSAPQKGDYYAPNACLQLGLVYIERHRTEQAKYYLEKVKTYSKHAYKQSLDHKAKMALAKLKKGPG